LLKKYNVQMPGVPHLTVVDGLGKVLANVKPSDQFYAAGTLDTDLLLDFLATWAPSVGE
jgi:hypothetical protein